MCAEGEGPGPRLGKAWPGDREGQRKRQKGEGSDRGSCSHSFLCIPCLPSCGGPAPCCLELHAALRGEILRLRQGARMTPGEKDQEERAGLAGGTLLV